MSFPHLTTPLKGASHEIEMGRIWYQKKDLEKLELRRYIGALTEVCALKYERFSCFPPFCLSNSAETLPKGAAQFCGALWRAGKIVWRPSEGRCRNCPRMFTIEF